MDEKESIRHYMLDWAMNYFRSRDAYEKKIVHIEKKPDCLNIEYKDKKVKILVYPDLEGDTGIDKDNNIIIITINNRKNLEGLYNKWEKFKENHNLKIYFVNPLSTTDKKWIINPFVHAQICDEASLKIGLKAMFETVEPFTSEMINKIQYTAK
jgi:hypothetical protein